MPDMTYSNLDEHQLHSAFNYIKAVLFANNVQEVLDTWSDYINSLGLLDGKDAFFIDDDSMNRARDIINSILAASEASLYMSTH